ncbi:hypothetical protein NTG1052_90003 [Candidatus Nitrotoga sp. 1052]|nr:hypothetical protein NTG1052_90003 [Candidatus Nitrotoga sp. 1052]
MEQLGTVSTPNLENIVHFLTAKCEDVSTMGSDCPLREMVKIAYLTLSS